MRVNYSIEKSELLSYEDKESEDYLISQVDTIISELVYDKDYLVKAYNYYNGVRDKDQFKYLEDVYGIGTPTSVEFIPLVRSHIDVLIGEHLQNKIRPKVTCKDQETLNSINRDRQLKIYEEEVNKLKGQLSRNVVSFLQGISEQDIRDEATETKLEKLKQDVARDFVSDFEIAAQYVLNNLIQSKVLGFKDKLKLLFLDLLVAGQAWYRVKTGRTGELPDMEVLDPFNTFVENDTTERFKKHATRAVYRRWMSKPQIIQKYGRYMNQEDLEKLDTEYNYYYDDNVYYVRNNSEGLASNLGVTAFGNDRYSTLDNTYNRGILIPVYEVEWLTNNEIEDEDGDKDYRLDRYSAVRIGQDIYLDYGIDESVVRSVERPLECHLSINGVTHNERGSTPYSLVLATASIQDKYDVLHFYRDNLIATSGVKGNFLDVAKLPTFLGQDEAERIAKYISYKKATGTALLDSSQEGREGLNTIYSGFDETVNGQSLQAIQMAIQATELTCSTITGVFRERLGGIEQRDAVTNVEVGIKQSATITKQYFRMMDGITNEALTDLLNACKVSYKEGKLGSLILGDKMQQIFTIDPQKLSFTDYDVHIDDTGDIAMDIENIKMLSIELIKAQAIDIDILLEGLTSQSLTEMKENVSRSYKKRMEENSQLEQAMQQVEQLNKQLQQTTQQAQQLAKQNETLSNQTNQLKARELEMKYEIDKEKNKIADEYNKSKLEIDEERTELEKLQLLDNNPYNNTVRK